MAKSKRIIRLDPNNEEYQKQVERYHNNVDWKAKAIPKDAKAQTPLSLDEMQERWDAYDWLIADDKHWVSTVIKHVDKEMADERKRKMQVAKAFEKAKEDTERRQAESTEINTRLLHRFIESWDKE